MADDNTNDQQQQSTTDQQQSTDTQQQADNLGDAGKRALEQERAARKAAEKQLKDFQKAQQDAELAGKPEVEQLTAKLNTTASERDAAFAERDAAQVELARYKAAAKYGLTDEDVEFLTGTPDEIESKAKKLSARLGNAGQPRRPAPNPGQGQPGQANPSGGDAAADFATFMTEQLNRRA